jgi:hypothetical protein
MVGPERVERRNRLDGAGEEARGGPGRDRLVDQ